jgi:hypothetical protein
MAVGGPALFEKRGGVGKSAIMIRKNIYGREKRLTQKTAQG